VALGGGPYAAYAFWATHTDPLLRAWTAQNLTPLGAWWEVGLAFSPALALAVLGLLPSHPGRRRLAWWAGGALLLAGLPLGLQRRLLLGWMVPLVGLAVLGLSALPRGRLWVALAWGLSLPTVLLFVPGAWSAARGHLRGPYLPRDEARAMAWLAQHTTSDALVLASPATGPFIPALTGRRVLYGHPMETVDAAMWRERTAAFFSGTLSGEEALGARLVRQALSAPLILICENAGHRGEVILNEVRNGEGDWGFDAEEGEYCHLMERGIVDPLKVTRSALENAGSIAGMMLTTQAVITEIPVVVPLPQDVQDFMHD